MESSLDDLQSDALEQIRGDLNLLVDCYEPACKLALTLVPASVRAVATFTIREGSLMEDGHLATDAINARASAVTDMNLQLLSSILGFTVTSPLSLTVQRNEKEFWMVTPPSPQVPDSNVPSTPPSLPELDLVVEFHAPSLPPHMPLLTLLLETNATSFDLTMGRAGVDILPTVLVPGVLVALAITGWVFRRRWQRRLRAKQDASDTTNQINEKTQKQAPLPTAADNEARQTGNVATEGILSTGTSPMTSVSHTPRSGHTTARSGPTPRSGQASARSRATPRSGQASARSRATPRAQCIIAGSSTAFVEGQAEELARRLEGADLARKLDPLSLASPRPTVSLGMSPRSESPRITPLSLTSPRSQVKLGGSSRATDAPTESPRASRAARIRARLRSSPSKLRNRCLPGQGGAPISPGAKIGRAGRGAAPPSPRGGSLARAQVNPTHLPPPGMLPPPGTVPESPRPALRRARTAASLGSAMPGRLTAWRGGAAYSPSTSDRMRVNIVMSGDACAPPSDNTIQPLYPLPDNREPSDGSPPPPPPSISSARSAGSSSYGSSTPAYARPSTTPQFSPDSEHLPDSGGKSTGGKSTGSAPGAASTPNIVPLYPKPPLSLVPRLNITPSAATQTWRSLILPSPGASTLDSARTTGSAEFHVRPLQTPQQLMQRSARGRCLVVPSIAEAPAAAPADDVMSSARSWLTESEQENIDWMTETPRAPPTMNASDELARWLTMSPRVMLAHPAEPPAAPDSGRSAVAASRSMLETMRRSTRGSGRSGASLEPARSAARSHAGMNSGRPNSSVASHRLAQSYHHQDNQSGMITADLQPRLGAPQPRPQSPSGPVYL